MKLSGLFDECLTRAEKTLKKKRYGKNMTSDEIKQSEECVAYGCIKFGHLLENRINQYFFSIDHVSFESIINFI